MRPLGALDRGEVFATKSAENTKKNRNEGLERLVDAFSSTARCADADAGRAFPLPDIRAIGAIFSPAVPTPKDVNVLKVIGSSAVGALQHDLTVSVFVARCGCVCWCSHELCNSNNTVYGTSQFPTGCAIF